MYSREGRREGVAVEASHNSKGKRLTRGVVAEEVGFFSGYFLGSESRAFKQLVIPEAFKRREAYRLQKKKKNSPCTVSEGLDAVSMISQPQVSSEAIPLLVIFSRATDSPTKFTEK